MAPGDGRSLPGAGDNDAFLLCARLIRARLSPEFDELLAELAELYEEDLCDEIVLNEVADFMADLLGSGEHDELVERVCAVIEELLADSRLEPVELVYDQLFSLLSPVHLERLSAYLGPLASELVASLGRGA